eukprot:CAMPEP_0197854838 /NCGR_PEP_ID=MMETSP1438-20131217/25428_1 /TAXON_ID=1461541 /ORGANISM="Pterosperma sp., Strain CCMP1384" /LENGTH=57 /DNA_ID=CAMNT_0043469727 /DNA_START=58 /DNA_END=231 /DNA_ORIENTATION=+
MAPPRQSPFKNLDAWRAHPLLKTNPGNVLPGFRIAVVAFAAYCAADYMTAPKKDSHH